MSILSKLTDFVGGSLFKEVKEGVMSYFPPDMSPEQKHKAELEIERLLMEKQAEANKHLRDCASLLDDRIAEQEGTAKDLVQMPILGKAILFARGAQRPVWGFATLAMDFMWFFGDYPHEFNEQQQTTLIIINSLVLGFLFGERAVLNLTPLITKLLAK